MTAPTPPDEARPGEAGPEEPAGPPPPAPERPRRIGLWGAPTCGKTTFLAALRIAAEEGEHDVRLVGCNRASTEFLADTTRQLKIERRFVPATRELPPNLAWQLHGTHVKKVRPDTGKLRFKRRRPVPYTVMLDLMDAPGGMFSSRPEDRAAPAPSSGLRFSSSAGSDDGGSGDGGGGGDAEERLVRHLAGCDGLLFLFDPTREREMNDAYAFFQRTVLQISELAGTSGVDHKLPHHLAVCITKFDHPEVYERAVRLGYVTPPASIFGMPRVDETRALEFFQDLYRGTHAHDPVNSLLNGIRSHFGESRTRYFVTSAIGFYRDPLENRFLPEDYLNIAERSDGGDGLAGEDRFRIRGDVAPINVLEPVMWLAGNVGEPR
ncbi:hypothetical protein [Actinomadura opuntiae]|uniref:hypothetical protein n=1 Tax=Actinomadura sp. OS1-43 TaxID=604315 RepID=UPI00255AAB6E|nr:hypothetical protein [Actinomadura sp. OS1-43]MDL4815221.1 hypothetical protein [Actinomadura sp. OS1-43]